MSDNVWTGKVKFRLTLAFTQEAHVIADDGCRTKDKAMILAEKRVREYAETTLALGSAEWLRRCKIAAVGVSLVDLLATQQGD